MRFGRLPHDPVRVAQAPSLAGHRFAAAPPLARLDRSHIQFTPGLYKNDVLPVCTAVALANTAAGVAAINGYALAIDAAKVPVFYAGCVGCAPTDEAIAATDGAPILDVLSRQGTLGFDIGPQKLVGLPGNLPLNRIVLANAINEMGHANLGVTLLERDMEMRAVWDVVPGRDDGKIVGGHDIFAWDYTGLSDDDTVRVGTWGNWQPATLAWVLARAEEAWAVFWRQLATASGLNIGVDPERLQSDLIAFSSAE